MKRSPVSQLSTFNGDPFHFPPYRLQFHPSIKTALRYVMLSSRKSRKTAPAMPRRRLGVRWRKGSAEPVPEGTVRRGGVNIGDLMSPCQHFFSRAWSRSLAVSGRARARGRSARRRCSNPPGCVPSSGKTRALFKSQKSKIFAAKFAVGFALFPELKSGKQADEDDPRGG